MLKIKNLKVSLGEIVILENINLNIKEGEIHALMGPKHSGKSDLAHVVIGDPSFNIDEGTISFKNKSLISKGINKISLLGIYVSFQHPPFISGLTNFDLVTASLSCRNDKRTLNDIEKQYRELCSKLGLSSDHKNKFVNDDSMSSLDHKKNELIQMFFLDPSFIIIDEFDKDTDDEEITLIGSFLKEYLRNNDKSAIIITQDHRLLDILNPNYVHILVNGLICESGNTNLYKRIIKDGYSQLP